MVPACAVAVGLAVVAVVLGWRGADWPAQLYRIDLFQRAGFTQWDNYWYGGHHAPGYSLLFPVLGAVLGPNVVAVLSAAVASFGFAVMADRWLPAPRAASVIFAAGTVTNIAVGRLTFALGLAIGVMAVVAMTAGWRTTALALAVLAPLASPVAGAFLLLAGTAWALATRPVRRLGVAVAFVDGAALAVLVLAFPEGGRFPFSVADFGVTAVVGLLAPFFLPTRFRAVRLAGWLYALAATVTVLVPNAMGANITRLGMYTAAPLAIGILWPARRRLAALLVGPLLVWQWLPASDGILTAGLDPSADPRYYEGLIAELGSLPPARVEIPFTRRHWEASYVAAHVPLARGWERQLDIGVNSLFYDGTLSGASYVQWLDDNAVGYVALPDADLDESALAEAGLLRAGLHELEPIWHDAHWRLWRVTTAKPLVEGPAHLTEFDVDAFTLAIDRPGDVVVRIHYSSHWDVDGPGCAVPTPDDWTLIRVAEPGTWRVRQVVARWNPFDAARDELCPAVG